MNETYTVIVNGKATSGLDIHAAYKLWREAVGNVDMMKDSEFKQAE